MAIRTELVLRLQNSPGALGRVCQTLGDGNVGIQAMSLDAVGTLRLVVDNPLSAAGILLGQKYVVKQRDVLFLSIPNAPGALFTVTRMIASTGVNVEYAYGSSLENKSENQGMAAVVIGVDDAQRGAMAAGV